MTQRIDHLIDGKPVAGARLLRDRQPGDAGGAGRGRRAAASAEVDAAVAAAKAAFPKWAATPATERARLMRKLGDLIAAARARDRARPKRATPARRSRRPASSWCRAPPTTSTTSPRCARASTATPIRPPTHLNYTLFHPVGVCALISPWNVPFMTATWKVAPCLAFGNTAVLKMSELSPLTRGAPRRARARGRHSARRAERRARHRQGRRRAAVSRTPTCARSRSPARPRPATASCKPPG